jgi:DNA-binding IclR family transcriptional regulator
LAVLRAFDDARVELGVSEIARTLGLSKSIVMRLVATLREAGFLERGLAHDKYRIGLAAFEVGSLYFANASLRREAEPVLRALAERFTCSTYIGTLSGDRAVYVSAIEGSGPIRVGPRIGSSAPAHTTAAGKVLLAYLEPDALERYLATAELVPETPQSISTRAELRQHLLQIRAAGFATNRGEHLNGVGAVGAPVFDARGAAVAAISLAFPIYLVPDDHWSTVTAAVLDAAQQISRRLGTPAYMTSGASER